MRILASICLIAVLAAPCFAGINGVLARERVVNLPQDQAKWYISVVGNANDARYTEIVGWFNSGNLKTLKNKVHFCPVTSDRAIYKERYAPNVKGLPTVRMQNSDAVVVYEAAGKSIPMTAEGLYGAIANAINSAQGVEFRPWRKSGPCPGPCPRPTPAPQPTPLDDPEPQPLDDPGPLVEPVTQGWPLWGLALLANGSFLVGMGLGYGRKLVAKLQSA